MNRKNFCKNPTAPVQKSIVVTQPSTTTSAAPKKRISKNIDHCCGILIRFEPRP